MSKLYNGSICLSDIPKDKITTSEKNGKKYLNFNLWVNDSIDDYGNIGSINVSQTKDERDAKVKKVYFGNIKPVVAANSEGITAKEAATEKHNPADDLPF